ncbi:MAG: SRPBCC domain-containing protein [Gillisia sp.]
MNFQISIDAAREKVWETLWDDTTYRIWTAIFSPGSRVETNWNEGSKVLFLNGENEGMVSKIQAKKDNEFMSFQHLGMVDKNGNEDTESEQVKAWAGSLENYYLKSVNGGTQVRIEIDVANDYKDYFKKTWPSALQKLKELAEQDKIIS